MPIPKPNFKESTINEIRGLLGIIKQKLDQIQEEIEQPCLDKLHNLLHDFEETLDEI